jgi:hypothetical protein
MLQKILKNLRMLRKCLSIVRLFQVNSGKSGETPNLKLLRSMKVRLDFEISCISIERYTQIDVQLIKH